MTIWYEHYRCQKISTIGQHQCTKAHGHKGFCTANHGMLNLKFGIGPTWEHGVATRTTNKEKVWVRKEFIQQSLGENSETVDFGKLKQYDDEETSIAFAGINMGKHYIHSE